MSSYKKSEIDDLAIPIIKKVSQEAQGVWRDPDSLYYLFRHIQIDKRGSFGERFFAEAVMKAFPRRIILEYRDGDQGEWDLKINGYPFEVKTSSIDVNNKFQNEGLNKDGDFYGVLFLCVTPNKLYFKFVKKIDIPFEKLHDRKKAGTGSGYKWDHKITQVESFESIEEFGSRFNEVFPDVFDKKKCYSK